jgi:hypothetical protein
MQSAIATRLELTAIPSELLQRMHAYWLSKCGSHPMPTRAEIDPVDFSWALGNVCLLDVETNPLRLRYRLAGTRLTRLYEMDLTGRTVDDIRLPDLRNLVRSHLQEVVETAKPNLYCISITNNGGPQTYVRLALPLRGPHGEVAMILMAIDMVGPSSDADDLMAGSRRRPAIE